MDHAPLRPRGPHAGPARTAAAVLLLAMVLAAPGLAAQAPGSDDLTVDLTLLGASVGWAHGVGEGSALGLSVGGGFPVAFTLLDGPFSNPPSASGTGVLGEVAHLSLLFRRAVHEGRTEFEGGPRVAAVYHGAAGDVTRFIGVYGGVFRQVGPVRLGTRLSFGRYADGSGESELNLAVVPLVLRLRLELDGGGRR